MMNLTKNWQLIKTVPGEFSDHIEFENISESSIPAVVPGTVALSYLAIEKWDIDSHVDFDESDYWYQSEFLYNGANDKKAVFLCFEGLATVCEIWLNGKAVLTSTNMFLCHHIDVTEILKKTNTLTLCFRSLKQALKERRPRPRWKTKVVDQQQLRWFRTTLLGRIPGWTPPVAPVGPWKNIALLETHDITNVKLNSQLIGSAGVINFCCEYLSTNSNNLTAHLVVSDKRTKLSIEQTEFGFQLSGELEIPDPILWWPHTHGQPHIYDASIEIHEDNSVFNYKLASVGFKSIELLTDNDDFKFKVNGIEVFCRGACWTINDIVSLHGDEKNLEDNLYLMRDAGANMIRIGGTMIYEQDRFYELCDELGILVWQDFMFANMDYPIGDESFKSSIELESKQQLTRLSKHVCLAIYCGNSEIEQQASMLGMEEELWSNEYFSEKLPKLCNKMHPDVPYISSTPTGRGLPFHTNKSVSHYYGVGAYLRSTSEVRSHNVKFTSECLGFSNIPIRKTRNKVLDGQLPVIHHPKWKERTPRDTGPGWDFEDVRDHYLKQLYSVEPTRLRSFDPERYVLLSELVPGEMMAQVFSEWRSVSSSCNGALVWFLKDLWPGAGWGVIDSNGLPKACYYYLKRIWQPIQVCITNESLNGIHVHLTNETENNISGSLTLTLIDEQYNVVAEVNSEVYLKPRSVNMVEAEQLLKGFFDVSYSYRFGPAKHNIVIATLNDNSGIQLSSSYYFVEPKEPSISSNVKIVANIEHVDDDVSILNISCEDFLYSVNIDVPGYVASDNYFHMPGKMERKIRLSRTDRTVTKCKGYVSSFNAALEVKIK